MPLVEHKGARIKYAVEGNGPPLVLHHGFTQRGRDWHRTGYVEALAQNYQVILIDARGHGDSDKPHERSAYAWPVQVLDVVAVLDALALRQVAYWGYSMGGEIGFGLASYAPERVSALLCGGASAHASDLGAAFRDTDGTDEDAFLERLAARVGVSSFPGEARARILENDLQALAAAAQDRPSMEHLLPSLKMPCFVYAGEADKDISQTRDCARHIPHAICKVLRRFGARRSFRPCRHCSSSCNALPVNARSSVIQRAWSVALPRALHVVAIN